MNYLTAVRSLDRYGWAMLATLFLGAPVALLAFIVLALIVGPLMAAAIAATVGINVALMRRYYREHRAHRARHGS